LKKLSGYQKNNNEGFSLVELSVVMGVMATTMAIGIPTYQGIQERSMLEAAKQSLLNMKSECELSYLYGMTNNFSEVSLRGYRLESSTNDCNILSAVALNNEKHPTFSYDFSTEKITCSYKNAEATPYPECKKIGGKTTESNNASLGEIISQPKVDKTPEPILDEYIANLDDQVEKELEEGNKDKFEFIKGVEISQGPKCENNQQGEKPWHCRCNIGYKYEANWKMRYDESTGKEVPYFRDVLLNCVDSAGRKSNWEGTSTTYGVAGRAIDQELNPQYSRYKNKYKQSIQDWEDYQKFLKDGYQLDTIYTAEVALAKAKAEEIALEKEKIYKVDLDKKLAHEKYLLQAKSEGKTPKGPGCGDTQLGNLPFHCSCKVGYKYAERKQYRVEGRSVNESGRVSGRKPVYYRSDISVNCVNSKGEKSNLDGTSTRYGVIGQGFDAELEPRFKQNPGKYQSVINEVKNYQQFIRNGYKTDVIYKN